MKTVTPYLLLRSDDNSPYFNAAYCKFYGIVPYVALFEQYPSTDTRVLLCRKVEEGRPYGHRLLELHGIDQDGKRENLGQYVAVYEGRSEEEVNNRLSDNLTANAALHSTLAEAQT